LQVEISRGLDAGFAAGAAFAIGFLGTASATFGGVAGFCAAGAGLFRVNGLESHRAGSEAAAALAQAADATRRRSIRISIT
jgi:hypothetical protein